MSNLIKTFEKFTRPEMIDGLELIGKMSVDDFISHLVDNDIDTKNKVFRLVDYTPSSKTTWRNVVRVIVNPETGGEEKRNIVIPTSTMFTSPFVIFPGNVSMVKRYFIGEGNALRRYTGKYPEMKNAVEKAYIVFNGVSITAMAHSFEVEDFETVLNNVFENRLSDSMKTAVSKCTRNYIGYNFDSVLIYEVDDTEEAVGALAQEAYETEV